VERQPTNQLGEQNDDRANWNLSRFLETLCYFGVVPFLGRFTWLQQLFGRQPATVEPTGDRILVAGATGGVGKRVVNILQQRGYRVRSLARNRSAAVELLGNDIEIVEADITRPETLTEAVFSNIKAAICCTGTRVEPVEGDTPDREKYYQGVKFYMPQVVDDPKKVEFEGITNLVNAAKQYLPETGNYKTIFDFDRASADLKELWGAVDDVVMGGVSESSIRIIPGAALFSGNVSTANSGGFASVRTRSLDPSIDLSDYEGVELRLKGDGNRYKCILRCDDKWDGVSYCYSFDTIADTWQTVRVPFGDLVPTFRAKTVPEYQFNPHSVTAFQLMLSKFEYDGDLNPHFTPGNFALQVATMKAYSSEARSQFVMVSSAGVTRPGREDLNLEEQPPAVKMNDQLGGILTWKLRGEDSVRDSGVPYTIIRPCALTEEEGGKALKSDRGDNLTGKCSRDDIAELCVRCLESPSATNQTFEVAEIDSSEKQDWQAFLANL